MQEPDFDKLEQQQQEERASFTSRKLDVIDAMLVDPRLSPADFKVGVALLQFMNSKTGALFPSIETIAENVHMSTRYVRVCLTKLKEARWLTWQRGNRQLANEYRFDLTNLDAMLDYRLSIQEGRRERKVGRRKLMSERNRSSPQNTLEGNHSAVLERNHSATPERNHSSTQHLKGTP